jgi:eukaryotic-like serine/threonine-protein kinase
VKSKWVNEEIRHFKLLGRADRLFCYIPPDRHRREADLFDETPVFPAALAHETASRADLSPSTSTPLAADARVGKDGKRPALLKVLASITDLSYDELLQRDRHSRRRWTVIRWVLTVSLIGVIAFGLSIASIYQSAGRYLQQLGLSEGVFRFSPEPATAELLWEFSRSSYWVRQSPLRNDSGL